MSFAIAEANLENSLLLVSFACDCSRRCFCSVVVGREDLFRIDSTQALNSSVLFCTGMMQRLDSQRTGSGKVLGIGRHSS
jgi:hypothetical protein